MPSPSIVAKPRSGYRLVVKSSLNKVLFETDQARLVEIFDDRGNLCGVLMRTLNDTLWQVSVKGDQDFEAFARQHGYQTATIAYPLDSTIHGEFGLKR